MKTPAARRGKSDHLRSGTDSLLKHARLVGVALVAAQAGASSRGVKRAIASARAALDREAAKIADSESAEGMGAGAVLVELHAILDVLEEEGPEAAMALVGELPSCP